MYTINLLSLVKTNSVEFIFLVSLFMFIVLFALAAGWVATNTGKSFRFWFGISFLIPFFPLLILLCIREKEDQFIVAPKNDLYDHLY
jgi:hypothetical protein